MCLFKFQTENSKLDIEKENDANEDDDGEEKKDEEKLTEDSLEKPLVVSNFVIEYVLIKLKLWGHAVHAEQVGRIVIRGIRSLQLAMALGQRTVFNSVQYRLPWPSQLQERFEVSDHRSKVIGLFLSNV